MDWNSYPQESTVFPQAKNGQIRSKYRKGWKSFPRFPHLIVITLIKLINKKEITDEIFN